MCYRLGETRAQRQAQFGFTGAPGLSELAQGRLLPLLDLNFQRRHPDWVDQTQTPPDDQLAHRERTLRDVSAVAAADLQVDLLLTTAVLSARRAGATWKQVGEAAGVSLKNAHARWRWTEQAPEPRRTGHARTRQVGGDTESGLRQPGLVEAAIRTVLHELGEPYEVRLPLDGTIVDIHLPKRNLTLACDGVRTTVLRHKPR